MCGRYSLTSAAEAVRQAFGYPERPNLEPRANIAPTQEVAAVRLGGGGTRHFARLRWGLIPAWAKDVSGAARTINARAESVAEKPSFRAAFAHRRCLIPADGFYEWKTEDGLKQPYRIAAPDGAVFAFAGLWERWDNAAEKRAPVESCTIVTTEANERLRAIHPRMPVILDAADYETWLDPQTAAAEALALLRPCPAERLTAYRVSRRVNTVANEDLSLIEPLVGEEPAAQARLL